MSRGPQRGRKSGAPQGRGRSRRGGPPGRGRSQRGTTQSVGDAHPERPRGPGGDVVEGRHAVRELLLAGNRKVREVVMSADMADAAIVREIVELAEEARVSVREVPRGKFDAMTVTEAAQGVMAKAAPLPDLDLEDLLHGDREPFLLLMDGITDPGNLGAMMRTGECAGVTGVVLPRHRTARVTPTVAKAAQGAIEHVPIATTSGIPKALGELESAGVWTVGLDVAGDTEIYDIVVADGPVALVLGAEGKGLSRLARDRCDVVATIPLRGVLGSLNVSAAAAVACFEIARHRSDRV
jgi:23S rRNA (guanosine2251-2'-O)-methyltransferase